MIIPTTKCLIVGKGFAWGNPGRVLSFLQISKSNILKTIFLRQGKCHFSTSATRVTHRNSHKSHVLPTRGEAKSNNRSSSSLSFKSYHQPSLYSPVCPQVQGHSLFHSSVKSHKELSAKAHQEPSVQSQSGILSVPLRDKMVDIPLLWFRDHCHCPKCFNLDTSQRNVDINLMQRDLIPVSVRLNDGKTSLMIEWKDGHISTFSIKELQEWFYPGVYRRHTEPFLWDCASLTASGVPSVPYHEHINTESGLRQTISNLVTYGFTFVDETPASLEATQTVAERVGMVMPTLYGGMWTLASGSKDFKDTAYSSQPLGAHTDLTYYKAGAGIQIFHGLKREGTGGETLLVDGFHAAKVLHEKYPESFECLTSCVVPHEYKEPKSDISPGYHLYNLCHVLTTHPNSGELIQIRFNPYDRAPLNTLPPNQIQDFYTAYYRLFQIIEDTANEFWIPLTPGRVLFIDNWRVMHGRAAFTGLRVLCGCYLQRDEWISKARVNHLF